MAKQWLLHTLATGWVDDLKTSSPATATAAAECEAVIVFFKDFHAFGKKFSPGSKADADKSTEVLERVKESLSTLVARSVADFAYDLHTGEHDEVIDSILKGETPDTVDWVAENYHR